MKLLYYDNKEIEISNGNEEFVFTNLALKEGFLNGDQKDSNWVLSKYSRIFNDKDLVLCICADFYNNSNYANISMFFKNLKTFKRRIKLNDDGSVYRDFLLISDPISEDHEECYFVKPNPNTSIKNYLSEYPLNRKVYRNYKASFVNNVLPDYFIYNFLIYSDFYRGIINKYGNDYDKIREILDNIVVQDCDLEQGKIIK